MILQTATGARQGADIIRHRARIQALQAERELPQGERREHAVIDPEIQHATNDLDAQQRLQDSTTTAVRRAGELLGYLITHATKPGSEPNNLLRRLQETKHRKGKCFDNSDINMLQELGYNSIPYNRALYILNLDRQTHHNNNNSFKNGYETSQHTR